MIFPWQETLWQQWQQQAQRLGHAYLLSGSAGIGIVEFAREMAQGLLCQGQTRPAPLTACQACPQCHQATQNTHPDFFHLSVLEDKKEISVDQVRNLIDKVYETSHQGGFKVVLVEKTELLNTSAFNALLKTLEEPPARTVLLLTTHQVSRLPATILSRCRQMSFTTPAAELSLAWLQQQLPQADLPLLKRALKINWGGVVQAKQWIDDKGYEIEAAWREDIKALQQGRQTVSQTVEKWNKLDQPQVVLDYFYLWTVGAVRSSLYQQKQPYNPNWLEFQKVILQARQYWHQNINKELLLESVCLAWLQQSQSQPSDWNLQKITQNPFSGQHLRGQLL